MKRSHVGIVLVLLLAVATIWAGASPPVVLGQDQVVVERLFRSVLTSVKPIFAPGQAGNPDAVIGFDTQGTVFEITEPIENGLIPRPRQSGAEPMGRTFGELRCIGNARVDRSKPMQIFVGKLKFVGRAMKFDATGTSIIHWCKNDKGQYSGVRWTDFSGAISNVEGRHQGAKGHLVGTRLLIGEPDLKGQSGLLILRLLE